MWGDLVFHSDSSTHRPWQAQVLPSLHFLSCLRAPALEGGVRRTPDLGEPVPSESVQCLSKHPTPGSCHDPSHICG